MAAFRVRLRVLSPLSTPVCGDTLFGHVCWGIVRHEGDDALAALFSRYDQGEVPLAISNAFPEGTLPVPVLRPAAESQDAGGKKRGVSAGKAARRRCVPASLLLGRDAHLSHEALRAPDQAVRAGSRVREVRETRLHATIDRLAGATLEETGLFPTQEIWFVSEESSARGAARWRVRRQPPLLDVYVVSSDPPQRVRQLLEWAVEFGYGADRSVGRGHLAVDDVSGIELPSAGNRAVALGHFVPAPGERLHDLRADLFTRRGKLGGDYLLSSNPFKKPIVMFREGATFAPPGRPVVGALLRDVHAEPRIRHHALAPCLLFTEEGGGG